MTRAQFALEEVESELGQMQFLTGKGLVPEARLRRVERAKRSRTLDLEAAEQDLKAVMERGREEREVAEIELKNATEELVRLEHMLASARVVAPVAGVVLVRGGEAHRWPASERASKRDRICFGSETCPA